VAIICAGIIPGSNRKAGRAKNTAVQAVFFLVFYLNPLPLKAMETK